LGSSIAARIDSFKVCRRTKNPRAFKAGECQKETNAMLTEWKKQEDLQFLNEVSCVPLQQGLRHLQKAFSNFFEGRAKYPNFKKKHHGGNAEFTLVGFPMEKRTGISSEMCPSIGDPLESRAAQRSPTIHNYGQALALTDGGQFQCL
jgi:transposase